MSNDVVDQLILDKPQVPEPLDEKRVEVAYIAITAPDAESYSGCAEAIVDLAFAHDGMVLSVLPIVVVAFGVINEASEGVRRRFVADVDARFPTNVAIIHGSFVATVGLIGGRKRPEFGCWWPGATEAFRQLARLEPGEMLEITWP